jgi:hypothetical protein
MERESTFLTAVAAALATTTEVPAATSLQTSLVGAASMALTFNNQTGIALLCSCNHF